MSEANDIPTARQLATKILKIAPNKIYDTSPPELAEWVRAVAQIIDDDRMDSEPLHMRLPCPECGEMHVDEGEFATKKHHTHACQHCGMVWRPALVPTVGVRFLPGFKNE